MVGGAALALAHRASGSTLDVDALALDHRAEVLAVAGEVAREQRLPPDWLNDAVRRARGQRLVPMRERGSSMTRRTSVSPALSPSTCSP